MTTVKQQRKPRPWRVHPIWRGIGCVMIILIPIMSYAVGDILTNNIEFVSSFFDQMSFFRKDVDLLAWVDPVAGAIPQVSNQLYALKESLAIQPISYFWGKMLIMIVLSMVLFAAFSILYSIVFKLTGPSPYGQLDVKPERYRRKKTGIKKIKY
jgi:hypothetical protein